VNAVTNNRYVVTWRALLALAACTIGAALLVTAVAAGSADSATATKATAKKMTVYSVATRGQFLNNADDRQRAIINSPFTTNIAKLMFVMKGDQKRTGPLPGDTALFTFALYKDPALKQKVGSSVFLCTYNFDNNAHCTAYYELKGGVLLANGRVNFKTFVDSRYSLGVRGGTDSYLGARGQVTINPANVKSAQRLAFSLL
jgi:uncharacterized membrane protein